MDCNEIPDFKRSRVLCRGLNLENELNNERLLKGIYFEAFKILGITPQPISPEVFVEKSGEVILRYAEQNKVNARKVVALISSQNDKTEACKILGRTATCLMEDYGLLLGGLKIS